MNEREIIKVALKSRGYTQAMLASMLGFKGQNAVAERLRGNAINVDTLLKFLNAMGYELVIRDKNKSNKENVWIVGEEK